MAWPAADIAPVRTFKRMLWRLQEYSIFVYENVRSLRSAWRYRRDTLEQMYIIGAQAFMIASLSGLFMGIIMAIEAGHRLETFGAKLLVGRTTSLALFRELGPVITGLLLAARTGAKNASELGSMQVSEQIDALRAFGTDPIEKLAVPRLIAALVMFLPLTLVSDLVGLVGGMYVSDWWLNVDKGFFWHSAIYDLKIKDLIVGFAKPVVFSFFISTISCYYGLATTGGTIGVGRAAVNAVVVSSVVVLFNDFIFTKVIWSIL
ncbi:MAG: ABC transporter permease [Ignavibacteriae bacterium]|nr:ABC transporter permease [Ignavibacteria bacterium]MBI3364574.1 ABC transporter permease [Ignavibacteriota bacterium]